MSSSTMTAMSRQPVIQVLRNVTDPRHQWGVRYNLFTVLSLAVTGGAPMWCVKRLRVVSWLVAIRRGCRCGSWCEGSVCGDVGCVVLLGLGEFSPSR